MSTYLIRTARGWKKQLILSKLFVYCLKKKLAGKVSLLIRYKSRIQKDHCLKVQTEWWITSKKHSINWLILIKCFFQSTETSVFTVTHIEFTENMGQIQSTARFHKIFWECVGMFCLYLDYPALGCCGPNEMMIYVDVSMAGVDLPFSWCCMQQVRDMLMSTARWSTRRLLPIGYAITGSKWKEEHLRPWMGMWILEMEENHNRN